MTNQERIEQLENALLIAMNALDRCIWAYGEELPCSNEDALSAQDAKIEIERILTKP